MTKITEIRLEITYKEDIWGIIQELQNIAEKFPDAVFLQTDTLNELIFVMSEEKELKQDD